MSLLLDARSVDGLRGSQTPRIACRPPSKCSYGADIVDLCEAADLFLDPWQQLTLDYWLGVRDDGKWAAFETGLVVPRQNGKGEVLLARELGSLFFDEWGERLVLHTAHEFKTSAEAFLRISTLIENCDFLRQEVKTIRRTTGEEGIEFRNGHRLRFLARSTSSGRGFTADLAIWDEAQILTDAPVRAMVPTMSARPNPQLVYAGTAGTAGSIQLGAVRSRALAGESKSLAYLEWSVDDSDSYDPDDPAEWAKANPSLGIRISADYIEKEKAAMSAEGFAGERLGVGDWPHDESTNLIPLDKWQASQDPAVRIEDPVVMAVEVDPHRTRAVIAQAGRMADGRLAVEIVDSREDLDWVVGRVGELEEERLPVCWVFDATGPASTFIHTLEADVNVVALAYREVAQASEGFYDGVMDGSTRHTGDVRLGAAVAGAVRREYADGSFAWGRRVSTADIGPLVAVSLARWGFLTRADELAPDDVYVG